MEQRKNQVLVLYLSQSSQREEKKETGLINPAKTIVENLL
jgi:hypothetical protein